MEPRGAGVSRRALCSAETWLGTAGRIGPASRRVVPCGFDQSVERPRQADPRYTRIGIGAQCLRFLSQPE